METDDNGQLYYLSGWPATTLIQDANTLEAVSGYGIGIGESMRDPFLKIVINGKCIGYGNVTITVSNDGSYDSVEITMVTVERDGRQASWNPDAYEALLDEALDI